MPRRQFTNGHLHYQMLADLVYQRDGYACRRCDALRAGKPGKNRLHVHHFVPIKHGGDWSLPNLITLCASCHFWAEGRPKAEVLAECRSLVEAARAANGRSA